MCADVLPLPNQESCPCSGETQTEEPKVLRRKRYAWHTGYRIAREFSRGAPRVAGHAESSALGVRGVDMGIGRRNRKRAGALDNSPEGQGGFCFFLRNEAEAKLGPDLVLAGSILRARCIRFSSIDTSPVEDGSAEKTRRGVDDFRRELRALRMWYRGRW